MAAVAHSAASLWALHEERDIAIARKACWTCPSRKRAFVCHSNSFLCGSFRIIPTLLVSNILSLLAVESCRGLVQAHNNKSHTAYAFFLLLMSRTDGHVEEQCSPADELALLRLVTNDSGLIVDS